MITSVLGVCLLKNSGARVTNFVDLNFIFINDGSISHVYYFKVAHLTGPNLPLDSIVPKPPLNALRTEQNGLAENKQTENHHLPIVKGFSKGKVQMMKNVYEFTVRKHRLHKRAISN